MRYLLDTSDHVIISHAITNRIPLISDNGKFDFYRNQGLELILNKKYTVWLHSLMLASVEVPL